MPIKVFLICLVCLLAGCSQPRVEHLNSNPFSPGQEELLDMTYWQFRYITETDNHGYLVKGSAHVPPGRPPVLREWIHNLRLSAYLSDKNGVVLASDSRSYFTLKQSPETSVPFEFQLKPRNMPASQDVYVTFGYSMDLTDQQFYDARFERPLTGETTGFSVRQGPVFR